MVANLVSKVTPVYPEDAKKARVSGSVILDATIGKDGTVENLKVLSGPAPLQQSALDSVRQWKYKPYLLNGDPVEVETKITVVYSLSK
jgi:protein TonB